MMQLKHVWFSRVTGKRAVLVAEKVDEDKRMPHDTDQFLRNDFSTGYVRTFCNRPSCKGKRLFQVMTREIRFICCSILLDEQTGPDGQPTVVMKRFVHAKFYLRRWQFPYYMRPLISDAVAFLTKAVVDALRRESERRGRGGRNTD